MSLVPDTSVPFPANDAGAWDTLRLKGQSGKTYTWPSEEGHGVVRIKFKPGNPRDKTSKASGAKKGRVKTTGKELGVFDVEADISDKGWPTWVAMWRLLAEEQDGPWRILHPLADTFDVPAVKIGAYPEVEPGRGEAKAKFQLKEIDPDTQGGKGAASGVLTPAAKTYEEQAQQDWIDEQVALAKDKIKVNQLAAREDLAKEKTDPAGQRTASKAITFGRVTR